jgi:hypothetical protein
VILNLLTATTPRPVVVVGGVRGLKSAVSGLRHVRYSLVCLVTVFTMDEHTQNKTDEKPPPPGERLEPVGADPHTRR